MKKTHYTYNYPQNRVVAKHLPSGATRMIAAKTGFSKRYVQSVLKGDRINERILNVAYALIEANKQIEQNIMLID